MTRVSEKHPVVRMRMQTQTEEERTPPRLVRSPERIHCPSGTRIDRRQVYPPRNPFYSLSKSVSCGKNDPTESASTFCKDNTMLSSLLIICSYVIDAVIAITDTITDTIIETITDVIERNAQIRKMILIFVSITKC